MVRYSRLIRINHIKTTTIGVAGDIMIGINGIIPTTIGIGSTDKNNIRSHFFYNKQ
jgi:hypothetical protein